MFNHNNPSVLAPFPPHAKFCPAAQFTRKHCHAKVSKNFEKTEERQSSLCPNVISGNSCSLCVVLLRCVVAVTSYVTDEPLLIDRLAGCV